MAKTYWYRFIKSTWGIAIGLTAVVVPRASYNGPEIEAGGGMWLSTLSPTWSGTPMFDRPEHLHYFTIGLRLVADQMRGIVEAQGPLTIRVLALEFALTDYQDEGLACAIAGWLAENYHFAFSPPPVHFDRESNRYHFLFPEWSVTPT